MQLSTANSTPWEKALHIQLPSLTVHVNVKGLWHPHTQLEPTNLTI